MNRTRISTALILTVVLACPSLAWSEAGQGLPVPNVDAARDVTGAKEMPDPKTEYKVLFDIAAAASKSTDVNPMLETAARYLNTLAKTGVPADHRKIAVIFHQGATDIIMNSDAFKARYNGQDNPNIALIQALKTAGVELHVCGQAVLARKIDPKAIMPEIQLDLWALTTIVNFELRGYVRIGG